MNKPENREEFDENAVKDEELVKEETSAGDKTEQETSANEPAGEGVEVKAEEPSGENAEASAGKNAEEEAEKSSGETEAEENVKDAEKPDEKNGENESAKEAKKGSGPHNIPHNIKSGLEKRHKKKHTKLKVFLILLLILVLGIGGTLVYNVILNQNFTVTFYQVRSDKVSDNIRIIELADLHNAEYGPKNEKLIETIKNLKPDLIFYAGDMMNYGDKNYSVLFDLSDKLSEIAPIYACYGNNELDQYLFKDKKFYEKITDHHVNMLSNEAVNIEVGKSVIQLIAISDNVNQFDVETNNSKKFLESLEPTEYCRICLTHYPELFLDKLLNRDIDIAFVGHAHGGQIRIPKIGGLFSTGEGFLPKLTSGVVEMKDGSQVVISRGLGNSSSIPRINNQPELVVVDLCWY